ncbi:hypothetical protein Tco_0361694, partial [Tanacetum coccineum]
MPSFPSSEPMVNYFDDFDYFKIFEKEFPAITYNDALTFNLDFSEPTVSPQHIDEFDETSLSECDGEEQNILLMWLSYDFYKKFYNSLGRAPNRCSSSIGKTRGLLSFTLRIGWEGLIVTPQKMRLAAE